MKRVFAIAAIAATMSVGAAHAANKNNVGCGWGTLMFKGETGTAPQVLAITTNGTLSNNLFGISFGTAGCTKNGVIDPPQAAAAHRAAWVRSSPAGSPGGPCSTRLSSAT